MKKITKKFYELSHEEKINYLLNNYTCNEIATMLVDELEKSTGTVLKVRISQEEFDNHFHIIKPRVSKD